MSEIRKTGRPSSASGVYDFSRTARAHAQAVEASGDLDEAPITGEGRELARALTVVKSAGELRAERIAALRAQIANGAYEPDARAIAREILGRGL